MSLLRQSRNGWRGYRYGYIGSKRKRNSYKKSEKLECDLDVVEENDSLSDDEGRSQ